MTAAERREAIRLVEESDLSVRRTLRELQLPRTTFYRWYRRYRIEGIDGLTPRPSTARRHWNRIPPAIRQRVVDRGHVEVGEVGERQRPRDGRRGHHQVVRRKAFALEHRALADAQLVLLVHHHQPEVREFHVLLN